MEKIIEIENLSFSYEKQKPLFENISLDIEKGCITTVLGANGCGKTTLFNLLTGNLKKDKGEIHIDNRKIEEYSLNEFAKKVSIVHQKNIAPADITVKKLVSYGRTPYKSKNIFASSTEEDEIKIERAMKVTETDIYSNRAVAELSGGQMQRVWIAMALAQDTEILFLDEPTTFLDVKYQLEILKLVRELNEEYGMTIVMVLHDINQALLYSDRIIALRNGELIYEGKPDELTANGLLTDIYDVPMKVIGTDQGSLVLPY